MPQQLAKPAVPAWDRVSLLYVSALAVIIIAVFHGALMWLVHFWWDVKEYSHGFLVPLIAVYLIWYRRDLLKRIAIRPSTFWGGAMIAASLALYVLAEAGGFRLGESVALVLLMPGLVLFALGWQFLRALAVPLIYLQFMVPWATELVNRIRLPFQLLSAIAGTEILRLLGLAVLRRQHDLVLPHISMNVAPQCSGVGFLVSVIGLAVVLVYLTQKTWLRAFLVVASVGVITIATNGVRVAIAGVLGEYYGAAMLHGPAHIFQGFFVEVVGVVILLLLNWRVSLLPSQQTLLVHRLKVSAAETGDRHVSRGRIAVLGALLAAAGIYGHVFAHPKPVPLAQNLAGFPLVIGNWTGASSDWIKGSDLFPGASEELTRTYRDGAGREVHLYIGYFAAQWQSNSLVNFLDRPLWDDTSPVSTHWGSGPQKINRSALVLDGVKYRALFWYELGSTATASRHRAKLHQIVDVILRGRNNGAVVVLATPLTQNSAAEDANLLRFAEAAMPQLKTHLR